MRDLNQKRDYCILCLSGDLEQVVELSPIPIHEANNELPDDPGARAAALADVPLDLNLCRACGHLQLGYVGDPEFMYRNYLYVTAVSAGLSAHFQAYAREVIEATKAAKGAFVVEIGSNDGTLLRFFQAEGMRVLGIDPATRVAEKATAQGVETLGEFFTAELAQRIVREHGKAAIIVANNVIANVDDLRDFAEGVRTLLAPDGVFVFETQYGVDVIERTLLDTVYHEHISYFMIKPTVAHFARHGMQVIDVKRVPTKGGSIRVSVQLAGGPRPVAPIVEEIACEEVGKGVFARPFYAKVGDDLAAIRREIGSVVAAQQRAGKGLAGYGAAIGTSTLLAQFDLVGKVDFLVDDDPDKDGAKIEGFGAPVPVLPRETIYERKPGAIVIFAWRYADAIISKHQRYLDEGGLFVVPLPHVNVVKK